MIVCPPKNDKQFKDLVASIGENKAYIAFFRNGHTIPDVETARAHLATVPAGYNIIRYAKRPAPAAEAPVGTPTPAAPPAEAPPAVAEIPIGQRAMQGDEARARLADVNKQLEDLSDRQDRMGPYKQDAWRSLEDEERELKRERLQRQAELGSPEAKDAIARYEEAVERHDAMGEDEDAVIRKLVIKRPLATAAEFKRQGHVHALEVERLQKESKFARSTIDKIFRTKSKDWKGRRLRPGETELDTYGHYIAEGLDNAGFQGYSDPASVFTETGILERIRKAFMAEERKAPIPSMIEMKVQLAKSAPPTAVIVKPEPFGYGAAIEGAPSIDFRTAEGAEGHGPEEWTTEIERSFDAGQAVSHGGNRSNTRVGVALLGKDGRVIFTGAIRPQQTPRVGKVARAVKEIAFQRMGSDRDGARVVDPNGKVPALARDVFEAGYKPLAVIHFDGEPAKIFKTYDSVGAFDEAYRVNEKTAGKQIEEPGKRGEVRAAERSQEAIEREIDDIGREYEGADPARQAELKERLDELFPELDRITRANQAGLHSLDENVGQGDQDIPFRTIRETEHLMPVAANRANEFQAVAGRLRNQGGRVDLFAQEYAAQGSAKIIQAQIDSLNAKLAQAKGPAKKALQEQIDYRAQRLADLKNAVGFTYNPWHIAVAMRNIQQAEVGDLVTLLHEASEQAAAKLDVGMRGLVSRAVEESLEDLRARAAAASAETGVPLARETGAIDLLSETLAQKMAAAGIPNDPTLVGQIVRWVKELYYRVAMAAQRAFGVDPDPKLALDWFENQLNRLVRGDYDQRFGRILDRFLLESTTEVSRRFSGARGTPGALVDYLDPFDGNLHQPAVEPTGRDALKWNIAFRTVDGEPGKELDIPDPEARARIDSAALNHLIEWGETLRLQIAPEMEWPQFWAAIGRGEDPKMLIEEQENRFPGAKDARIGGDRMTNPMNDMAQLTARQLLEKFHFRAIREAARAREKAEQYADALTQSAQEANKLEGDFRNSALHDDFLKQKGKNLVRELVRDYNRGLDTADSHGELARAVRESEGLMESDPIPDRFQEVFRSISDGGISLFGYMKEIANLDLPLADMTNREVLKAISDNAADTPVLEQLSKNRPLAVALTVLARKNSEQVDQIQLGWLRNMEQFQAIHADLKEIRDATTEKLRSMQAQINEQVKAKGLRERLKRSYLQKRAELRGIQGRVDRATAKAELLDKAIPPLSAKVADLQIAGAGAPSEWTPKNGADWISMRLKEDGTWTRMGRVLRFKPDGSAVDPAGIRSAIAENSEWLDQHKDLAGSQLYERVKRQTTQIAHIDVARKYEAGYMSRIDRWVTPIADEAASFGGAGARMKQMMLNFQRILYFHNQEVEVNAHVWSRALLDAEQAAGITDHGTFFQQLYHPVMYFLGTNPGLEEGPSIREATRMARARLAKPPAEDFNERFADFLRKTKAANEKIEDIAQREGAFVKDKRLKSELRRAVARGWLTGMRGMDGGVVATIIRDMQKAGWRLEMKDQVNSRGEKSQRIVRATTFDHLRADDVAEANSEPLDKALQQYFTPGIIQRWLEPFINKGGIEVLKWEGKPILQQDLQDAWVESGGKVLKWIDAVGARVGLHEGGESAARRQMREIEGDIDEGEEKMGDPLAEFRLSVLHQLNGLFLMESRMAYDVSQVRSIFDPMGPKPHVIMDARENDLLPPEHLRFQTFDPTSSRMMLGQVAFHAAFGRNAERMVAAMDELKQNLSLRHQEYQSLKATSRPGRVAEAAARGWNYKELEHAAKRYDYAADMQRKLEGIYGVNNPAGPFMDMRGGMEVIHAMAGQIVDNPKVGLYHVISLLERPFAMKSLGPLTLKTSVGAAGNFLKTNLGSMLEALNLHILHSADWAKEVGAAQGSLFRNQPWSIALADVGQRGRFQNTLKDKYLIRPLRLIRYMQQKGVAVGIGKGAREFPRFAGIPGMGVLNTIMQIASTANTGAQVRLLETLVAKGIRYFSTHREDYENQAFRFKATDLLGKWDKGVFDYFRNKTVEYGMGTIEDIVRQAMPAATKGERLVNKDQVLRLAMMAANELDGASSINTTPSVFQSNAMLRLGMPLLRWPVWKMHQTHEGLKDALGRKDMLSLTRGLATLALWNLPMGLTFSFLMDRYDDKLLHKKSNLPPLEPTAMIPFVGPEVALMTSDRSVPKNLLSFLVRGAKAGNVYGLAADMAAQFAAPYDPASGQRQFSMDQRVLVMSQFLNFQQAVRNLINQGGDTSWASVWRPFVQSMGGNGVLQGVDMANNILGLDNQESRLVMRINAQNWLRSAGDEAGLEIRGSSSGGETPTPMTPWIREMQLAAMAGDRMGFLDAHRNALEAARRAVADDPRIAVGAREHEANQRVLTAWGARNPEMVFRFKPSPAQMAAVFANMDDEGQRDVREALQRYQQFTALISPTPFQRMIERQMAAATRMPAYLSARKQNTGLLFATP